MKKSKGNSELNKAAIVLLVVFCTIIGILLGWLWGAGIIGLA